MRHLTLIALILTLSLHTNAQTTQTARGHVLCSVPKKMDHVSLYINSVWNEAERCARKYRLPMQLILAQMCLESGYGRSVCALKRNNHLGIRLHGKYASFSSLRECLEVYGRTLSGNKYRKYGCQSIPCWLWMLDTNCYHMGGNRYGKKIMWIIETFHFAAINDPAYNK